MSCHTTQIVQEWFEKPNKEFKVLTRPTNVLYLIKHLWDVVGKPVQLMEKPPHNLQHTLPQHTFRGLVGPMPQQIRDVLVAQGGPNRREVLLMLNLIR